MPSIFFLMIKGHKCTFLKGFNILQEIKIANLTLPLPDNLKIIEEKELKRLQAAADYRAWWNLKDVCSRYKVSKTTIFSILGNPKFKPLLKNKCVRYGTKGRTYLFEPEKFSKFMRDWFPEIAKEIERGV